MSPTTIRLVDLQPGKASEQIAISLLPRQLNPSSSSCGTDYDAVPYAVRAVHKETIYAVLCQGKEIPVPETIYAALWHLRDERLPTRLWIDAICIDQEDAIQRRTMLPLVPQIFTHARSIIIWLGTESSVDREVLKLIEQLDRQVLPGRSRWSKLSRAPKPSALPTAELLANMKISKSAYQQLMHFFERPWFRQFSILRDRTWSTQQQVIAQVGSQTIAFDSVMRVAEALCQLWLFSPYTLADHTLERNFTLPAGLKYPERMFAVRNRGIRNKKMSYLTCFYLATIHDCFMPSWKIYSMLGWVDLSRYQEDISWEFDPDYNWLGYGENHKMEASPKGKMNLLRCLGCRT